MLKVLHLLYSFKTGGAEKLVLNMLQDETHNNNVENHLIVMTGIYDDYFREKVESLNIQSTFYPKDFNKKRILAAKKLLNYIKKNKIDIIHVHESSSEKWAILLKLFCPKLKIVHTVHDRNILSSLSKPRLTKSKIFTDKIVCVSKSVYDEAKSLKLKNAVRIDNGICLSSFKKSTMPENSEKLNLINVSRALISKKGQDILLEALKMCKEEGLNFHCNIIGSGEDDGKIKSLVESYKLEKHVSLLGKRHDVNEFLSKTQVFILPSRYEGLPLVLLEAMASGLCVIASDIDSNSNLIENGKNGILFESENPHDLKSKILSINSDRELLKQIKTEGEKFVLDFDITKMCNNYHSTYTEICK